MTHQWLLQCVEIEIHGGHESQSHSMGPEGGQEIRSDHRRRDAMEVDEKVRQGQHGKDNPSVSVIAFLFTRHSYIA